SFVFATPKPLPADLSDDISDTNTVAPGHIKYFAVQVPSWASFATNALLFADNPVTVIFNQTALPTSGAGTDVPFFANHTGPASRILGITNSFPAPSLLPGATYYLAVQNNGAVAANFALQVNFDVTPLTLNVP